MSALNKIVNFENKIKTSIENEKWWYGFINLSGKFFKDLFSYTLGLAPIYIWAAKLNLPRVTIVLPTPVYNYDYYINFLEYRSTEWVHFIRNRVDSSPLLHFFAIGEITYTLNPVSTIPAILNYIFRTLGKILGWVLVSPITIPAYIGYNLYQRYQTMVFKNNFDKMNQCDKQKILENYFEKSSLETTTIIEFFCFNDFKKYLSDNQIYVTKKIKKHIKELIEDRKKYLEEKKLGIFYKLFPIFVSKQEIDELNDIKDAKKLFRDLSFKLDNLDLCTYIIHSKELKKTYIETDIDTSSHNEEPWINKTPLKPDLGRGKI